MYVSKNEKPKAMPIQRLIDTNDSYDEQDKEKTQKLSKIPIPIASKKSTQIEEPASTAPLKDNNLFTSGIKSSLLTSTPKSPRYQAPVLRNEKETHEIEQENINLPKRRSIPIKRKLDYLNPIRETSEKMDAPIINHPQMIEEHEQIQIDNIEINNVELDESNDDPSKYKLKIRKSNNKDINKEKENINTQLEKSKNSIIETKAKKPTTKILQSVHELEENRNKIVNKETTKSKSKPRSKNTNRIVNTLDKNDEVLNGPRRSKRVRVDPTQEAVYKFESLNGVIVSSLVTTTKKKFVPAEVLNQAYKTSKKKKNVKKSKVTSKKSQTNNIKSQLKKKEIKTKYSNETLDMKIRPNQSINTSQETVCLEYDNNDESNNENEIRLYTFSKNNLERDYVECTDGISLAALSEKEALMRVEPKAATVTNKHDFWTTYFVQEGECLLSLNGNKTKHAKADIFIIPKGKLLINFYLFYDDLIIYVNFFRCTVQNQKYFKFQNGLFIFYY